MRVHWEGLAACAALVVGAAIIGCGGGGSGLGSTTGLGGSSGSTGTSGTTTGSTTTGGTTTGGTTTGGTTTGGSSGGGGGNSGRAPWPKAIDGSWSTTVLQGAGAWASRGVEFFRNTYVWRTVATQYQAQGGLVTPDTFDSFKNNGPFSAQLIFDRNYGWASNTIPTGSYQAAIRNSVNSPNSFYMEVSYIDEGTIQFTQHATQTTNLGPGGRAWMGVNVQQGYSTFVNGSNTGIRTDIIPESELDNFRSGRGYQRYTAYMNDSGAKGHPLHWRLNDNLPPGNYYCVAYNNTAETQSITQWAIKWATTSGERGRSADGTSLTPSSEYHPGGEEPIEFGGAGAPRVVPN